MAPLFTGSKFGFGKKSLKLLTEATGGTITLAGGSQIHTFTSPGTFTLIGAPTNLRFLVVGGGGGGGPDWRGNGASGGGGGAGAYVEGYRSISSGSYSITIGSGGPSSSPGGSSTFSTFVTAHGGGAGGGEKGGGASGGSGGGGGGGPLHEHPFGGGNASNPGNLGGGTFYGNRGGDGGEPYEYGYFGGGGGGAAAAGNPFGGPGGSGRTSDITGSSVTYAQGAPAGGGPYPNYGSGAGSNKTGTPGVVILSFQLQYG